MLKTNSQVRHSYISERC
uniref:Uncharacterized protein n=1 Tax=Rhizophora mucronata TaxID=61149 RepID=A0A2P2Q6X8_RHIMU